MRQSLAIALLTLIIHEVNSVHAWTRRSASIEPDGTISEDRDLHNNEHDNNDDEQNEYHYIQTDFGEPQDTGFQSNTDNHQDRKTREEKQEEVVRFVQQSRQYMDNTVRKDDFYSRVRDDCRNRHASCSLWALEGHCDVLWRQHWMRSNCAPACQSCEALLFDQRCPWTPTNETNAWKPESAGSSGDAMFQRITTDPQYTRTLQIHSQPTSPSDGGGQHQPWIITLDNFLTDEECDAMVEYGQRNGYKPSMDMGHTKQADGTYNSVKSAKRTSSTAWCWLSCYDDPRHQSVLHKIEHLTGIPRDYYSYVQLLHYSEGQFYGPHHDYFPHTIHREEGVRILTVFLYLNNVTNGGGTNFPNYNITIQPQKGRILLWPNVLNEEPHLIDNRTVHQALPPIGKDSVKYGANTWIYLRKYKDVFHRGCASTK